MLLHRSIASCITRQVRPAVRGTRRKPASVRPSCERLEDRTAPAGLTLEPAHIYDLNGTLNDQMGGPALVADGGTLQDGRYVFGANQGLQLSGALANTGTYSVVMRFELDSMTPFYKKILDFSNRASDNGLYVVGSSVQLYPGSPGPGTFAANTDVQLALTRDGSTGQTKVYLNGALQQTYTGLDSTVAISSNLLIFFEDDRVTGGSEAVGGSVDYIQVYNGALTAADVASLAPTSITLAADQDQVAVEEGQTASNTGTWAATGSAQVSLSASTGTITQNTNGTWSWSAATADGPDDSRTVTITATDTGGSTRTTSFALVVDNALPIISADLSEVAVVAGQSVTVTGNWSDPGGDDVELSASVGDVTRFDDGTWVWTYTSTGGPDESQVVTITAIDSDGAVQTTSFGVVVENPPPPVVADVTEVVVLEGQTAAVTGTWSDPGDGTVTLSASIGTVVSNGDGTWRWTFASADGPDDSQIVTITATDSDGATSSASFALEVTNAPPVVAADASSVGVAEGQTASVTGTWSDPGADIVTLSASIGTVVSNGDGTWTWSYSTADGPDDSQVVTITATDSDGAVQTTSFALDVENAPPAVAADAPIVSVVEGSLATMTGTWSDPGADDVTLSASVGTVVQNADGTWTWSYSTADGPDESQIVTITATDSDGATSHAGFALNVENAPPAATAAASSVAVTEGQTASVTGTWSDPGSDDVTLSASIGTVVQNGDGTWTWRYSAADGPSESQIVTITATDSDGLSTSVSFALDVENAAPTFTQVSSSHASIEQPSANGFVTVGGAFADAGSLDTHTVTVNWGDGSAVQTVSVNQLARTFQGGHQYTRGGVFTVTVTLTDDEGATVTQTTSAVVSGVGVVNGTLYVIGTPGRDEIFISRHAGRRGEADYYRVQASLGEGGRKQEFTVAVSEVSSLVIVASSNDRVQLQRGVSADVQATQMTSSGHRGQGHGAQHNDFLWSLASFLDALRQRHQHG